MIAMLTTLEVVSDPHWFLDSGATNHYTPTIDNLTNKSTYDGPDQVHMSNGESEPISHIGKAFLHLSSSPCVFHLKNLLHISHLTKNLICVSKFSQDNKVFEFHLDICFVKDQATSSICFQGILEDGLYAFHVQPSKTSSQHPKLSTSVNKIFNKSNYTTTLSR